MFTNNIAVCLLFCLGGGQNLTLIEEAFHENWGRRPNLINLTCKGAKCGPGSKGKKTVCLHFYHSFSCLFTFLGVKGIMGLFNVLFEEIHFDRQHTLFCRYACMYKKFKLHLQL